MMYLALYDNWDLSLLIEKISCFTDFERQAFQESCR